jgi:uncharacterized protein YdhG (YjbR/CyaY superfamily)
VTAKKATNAPSSADVDAYLATLPDDLRMALEGLRRTIRAVAPDAVETISYRLPTFRYLDRPLVAIGAGRNRNHCALYVLSSTFLDPYRDELSGYDTSTGTIRFTPDAPLPERLVTTLVKARMAATEAETARRARQTR